MVPSFASITSLVCGNFSVSWISLQNVYWIVRCKERFASLKNSKFCLQFSKWLNQQTGTGRLSVLTLKVKRDQMNRVFRNYIEVWLWQNRHLAWWSNTATYCTCVYRRNRRCLHMLPAKSVVRAGRWIFSISRLRTKRFHRFRRCWTLMSWSIRLVLSTSVSYTSTIMWVTDCASTGTQSDQHASSFCSRLLTELTAQSSLTLGRSWALMGWSIRLIMRGAVVNVIS